MVSSFLVYFKELLNYHILILSISLANIAGLPANYGLYGSFLGCIVYIFLGSCKDVPMGKNLNSLLMNIKETNLIKLLGPTAIAALLTYQTAKGNFQKSVLLCFLAGVVELLMGLFGLGFLVDFVSGPVSSGFTSAVALIIVTSQVKDIFGITAKGGTFVEIWSAIFKDIKNLRTWDTSLGAMCIAVLLMMRVSYDAPCKNLPT